MRRTLLCILFAVLCALAGALLGESYIGRLPNHAGYFLVAVDDEVKAEPPPRSRAYFVIVDGLRRDHAEAMASTRVLERSGQCRVADQGSYTVSRPVYTLLSAGLEVDRAGSRNNDLTTAVAVESIWEVAREKGLRVSGASHLSWLEQLFPRGFDRYTVLDHHAENVFAPGGRALEPLDVNVFHPLYVDDAGHRFGAASPEYRAAVARADRELGGLLARVDLTRDLVVLTADHGHRDAGGHGGAQPEIAQVLTCFAGPNVVRRSDRAPFDGRSTAPALAALLGLRFPRHMRAESDGLDALPEIVAGDAAYLADRREAVERFRAANREALVRWLGDEPGTWARLYEREARKQHLRALAAGALAASVTALVLRRRRARSTDALRVAAWLAVSGAVVWAVHHAVLGDFDYTVINQRDRFIPRAALVAGVSAATSVALHRVVVRREAGADFLLLLGLLLLSNVAHVFVYGWPLGFPLPPPSMRYFPFFGAIALAVYAGVAVVLVLLELLAIRSRRGAECSAAARSSADER